MMNILDVIIKSTSIKKDSGLEEFKKLELK